MKNIRPTRAPEERAHVSTLALVLHIAFIFAAFVALLLVNFWPDRISLEEGSVSPKSIMAERKVEILNEKATDEARRRAAAAVGELYTFDNDAVSVGLTRIENSFLLLDKAQPTAGKPLTNEEINQLSSQLPIALSNQDIRTLLSLSVDARFLLQNGVRDIYYRLMDDAITESKLEQVKAQTQGLVKEQLTTADAPTQATLARFLSEAVQVNQLYSRRRRAGPNSRPWPESRR
jgi:membrane-associated HD superfamily phosphohydrolase